MGTKSDVPGSPLPTESVEAAPSSAEDPRNRRVSDRYDVTWAVDCQTEDTFLYASIANISAMGIFVRTVEPLAVGTELILRFAPQEYPEGFQLRGSVQWINPASIEGPNPGMGIRFKDLSVDDRERIVEVIHTIAYLREDAGSREN